MGADRSPRTVHIVGELRDAAASRGGQQKSASGRTWQEGSELSDEANTSPEADAEKRAPAEVRIAQQDDVAIEDSTHAAGRQQTAQASAERDWGPSYFAESAPPSSDAPRMPLRRGTKGCKI